MKIVGKIKHSLKTVWCFKHAVGHPRFFESESQLHLLSFVFSLLGLACLIFGISSVFFFEQDAGRTLLLSSASCGVVVAGLLVLMHLLMQRSPSDEMKSWLRAYSEEFGLEVAPTPTTKEAFAPYVRDAYERRAKRDGSGSLAEL